MPAPIPAPVRAQIIMLKRLGGKSKDVARRTNVNVRTVERLWKARDNDPLKRIPVAGKSTGRKKKVGVVDTSQMFVTGINHRVQH